jgi:hypothetical protein
MSCSATLKNTPPDGHIADRKIIENRNWGERLEALVDSLSEGHQPLKLSSFLM